MVTLEVKEDGTASKAFAAALQELAKSLGDACSEAPRRMAISMCKIFRANTRIAPKFARSSEYKIYKGYAEPKYIHSKKDGRKLRRFVIDRPPRGNTYQVFAEDKRDARLHHLALHHRGLARQSWGWVMHNIFNGAAPDTAWKRRKNDRRNPKDATSESMSVVRKGVTTSSGEARISNRLDYAAAALKISVDEVARRTANRMIGTLETRRLKAAKTGMSAAEIREAANKVAHDFKARFAT